MDSRDQRLSDHHPTRGNRRHRSVHSGHSGEPSGVCVLTKNTPQGLIAVPFTTLPAMCSRWESWLLSRYGFPRGCAFHQIREFVDSTGPVAGFGDIAVGVLGPIPALLRWIDCGQHSRNRQPFASGVTRFWDVSTTISLPDGPRLPDFQQRRP